MPFRMAWLLLLSYIIAGSSVSGKPVSYYDPPGKPILAGDRRAVALRHGRLVAWDTRTGRRLWAFGHGLGGGSYRDADGQWGLVTGLVFAADGRVFTHSHFGRLYAVSAQSGRMLWSEVSRQAVDVTKNKYGTWRNFNLVAMDGDANLLATAYFHGLTVYDAATGHELWRITLPPEDTGSMNVNLTPKLVLLERFTEGAGMHTVTDALDRRTGKLLWTGLGAFDPEKSCRGRIDLEQFYLGEVANHPTWLHHQVVAERTGKVLKEYLTK